MEFYEFPKQAIGCTYLLSRERMNFLKTKGFQQHPDYPFLFSHYKININLYYDLRESQIEGVIKFEMCNCFYLVDTTPENNKFYRISHPMDLVELCGIEWKNE
jgi:hypothetical protein